MLPIPKTYCLEIPNLLKISLKFIEKLKKKYIFNRYLL